MPENNQDRGIFACRIAIDSGPQVNEDEKAAPRLGTPTRRYDFFVTGVLRQY
jgi:hypothetical protein